MIHFLSPGDPTLPTGGYRYNAQVVAGLRALGERVRVHVVEAAWPDPEEPVVIELPEGEPVVVDELMLCGVQVRGGPTVALLHSPLFREQPRELQGHWRERERQVLSSMELCVATSPLTAQDLGVDAVLIPPGVAPVAPESRCPEPAWEPEVHELLNVASLIPRKGQDVLLAGLRELLAARPQASLRLRILGAEPDPAWAAQLRTLAEGLPVDFLGTRADLGPIYRSAHLLVHLAHFESWGMVLDEALAHDLPVLSTPAGALSRGGVGVMGVPPGDPGAVASALALWLDDPGHRASLRAGARAVRAPDWTATARAWKAALDDLRA